MLYFAYGSNLDPAGMRHRAPGAVRSGPLVLDGGLLVFRGVADVVSDEHGQIAGGVWRITPTCERALDRYEGVASGLYKKRYLKLKVNGVAEDCLYYQMNKRHSRAMMPPAEAYLQTIARGYEYFGRDRSLLDKALAHSWDDKNKTQWLKERYVKRGRQTLAQRGSL